MWSKNEVGINAVIFILFIHHNFKLYLEWSSDATQRYFAERRMQNAEWHCSQCANEVRKQFSIVF